MRPAKKTAPKLNVQFALKLYALQQEVYERLWNGDERFLCLILGRQSGKSFLGKYIMLDGAINRNKRIMWVTINHTTARPHWKQMVKWVKDAKIPCYINRSEREIEFPGGGWIGIRSAIDPDSIRGDSLDLIICDEAAYWRDGEYVNDHVLQPMITATRGKMLYMTTPKGLNWVYNIYKKGIEGKSKNKLYISWRASSYESPYQDKELLDEYKATKPSIVFREEYGAEFLAGSGGVFAGVEQASIEELQLRPIPGHVYIAGADIGFAQDFTCFTIIDVTEYPAKQVFGTSFNNEGTIKTAVRIKHLIDHWLPKRFYMENNGVGETMLRLFKEIIQGRDMDLLENVNERAGNDIQVGRDEGVFEKSFMMNNVTKITAIHMDNTTKRQLVESTAAAIEYGGLSILTTNNEYGDTQIKEMSTYQREPTASGQMITYNAIEGSHDDTVSALYLACRGLPKPVKIRKLPEEGEQVATKNPFRGKGKRLKNFRNKQGVA